LRIRNIDFFRESLLLAYFGRRQNFAKFEFEKAIFPHNIRLQAVFFLFSFHLEVLGSILERL